MLHIHTCNIQWYIHKNESKHSEVGPVRQNPIQRTVRSVHVCALYCAQLLHTILHRTDLIIFPLTLQTITIALMMSVWGKGGKRRNAIIWKHYAVSIVSYGKNLLFCKHLPIKVLQLRIAEIWTKKYYNTYNTAILTSLVLVGYTINLGGMRFWATLCIRCANLQLVGRYWRTVCCNPVAESAVIYWDTMSQPHDPAPLFSTRQLIIRHVRGLLRSLLANAASVQQCSATSFNLFDDNLWRKKWQHLYGRPA